MEKTKSLRLERIFGACLLATALVATERPVLAATAAPAAKVQKTAPIEGLAIDGPALDALDEACRKGSLDLMTACARRDPLTEESCSYGDISYGACLSLIPGQDARRSFFGGKDSAYKGRDHSLHMRLAWAAIKGTASDIEAIYPEMSEAHGGSKNIRELFDLLASNLKLGQGTKAFCDAAQGLRDWKGRCPDSAAYLDGAPEKCGVSLQCKEEAGLIAALRSKDPKSCRASALCVALTTHDVQACKLTLIRPAGMFCDRIADAKAQLAARQKADLVIHQKAEETRLQNLEKKRKLQEQHRFKQGEAMQTLSPEVQARMKAIEDAGHSSTSTRKATNGGAP